MSDHRPTLHPASPDQIAVAERRIFGQPVTTAAPQTSTAGALVGPDGRALTAPAAAPSAQRALADFGYIDGVGFGVAFLFMADDMVGICHLEANDCEMATVQVAPDTLPVTFLRLKVPPAQQLGGQGWDGTPATLAHIIDSRRQWGRRLALVEARMEAGQSPDVAIAEVDALLAIEAEEAQAAMDEAPVADDPGTLTVNDLQAAADLDATRQALQRLLDDAAATGHTAIDADQVAAILAGPPPSTDPVVGG